MPTFERGSKVTWKKPEEVAPGHLEIRSIFIDDFGCGPFEVVDVCNTPRNRGTPSFPQQILWILIKKNGFPFEFVFTSEWFNPAQ